MRSRHDWFKNFADADQAAFELLLILTHLLPEDERIVIALGGHGAADFTQPFETIVAVCWWWRFHGSCSRSSSGVMSRGVSRPSLPLTSLM